MKLSIVIPTYNARSWVEQTIRSIQEHAPSFPYEVLLVDDCSTDRTNEAVESAFPAVRVIRHTTNQGFSKSTNSGLRVARGEYILMLNNDTLVHPGALEKLVDFLETRTDVGVVGPRVLSRDGSLQQQCRRRIPTPWAALLYLSGIAGLFPKSPRLARYLITEADEHATLEVDAVSGCCMLARRAVVDRIGYFDEEFFLYGEDLDYCHRTKLAGWRVFYFPDAVITHFGGQGGTAKRRLNSTIQFYRAMWLFYRKHRAPQAFLPERALVYSGIAMKGALAVAVNAMRRSGTPGSRKPN